MIKAIIFDMDGTIFDSKEIIISGILSGLEKTYKKFKLKRRLPSSEQIVARIGTPSPQFFIGLIPKNSFKKIYPYAYNYTLEECIKLVKAKKGKLIKNTKTLLKRLNHKVKLGLVTVSELDYMEAVLSVYNLKKFFTITKSIEEIKSIKRKKSDLIKRELKYLKIKPSEAIMVGDRASDVKAAKEAGCYSAGVLYGYGSKQELKESDFKIKNLKELIKILS